MKKDPKVVYHNKLVRDKVIDQLRAKGIKVAYRELRLDEEFQRFVEKLVEESKEVVKAVEAGDREHLLEEFGDVWEAWKELEKLCKPTAEQLIATQGRPGREVVPYELSDLAVRIGQVPPHLASHLVVEFLGYFFGAIGGQGFGIAEVHEACIDKRREKGGFDKRLFLISTEETPRG
jgi:phosphoribosyl-ATP pyrophosphohydrolase